MMNDVMIHEDFQREGFLGFVFSPAGWHEGLSIFSSSVSGD